MDYNRFKILFHNFQLQNIAEISSFSMSDDDRVLQTQVSETIYPQLQLDRPIWTPSIIQGGEHSTQTNITVAILDTVEGMDNWTRQEQVLEETYPLAVKLIAYLDYQQKLNNPIRVLRYGQIYAIERHEGANLWGWGIPLTLKAPAEFCHDDTQDVMILNLKPEFVEGQTILQIDVEGQNYQVEWDEERRIDLILKDLTGQINNDGGHTIQAFALDGILILKAASPGDSITIDKTLPGHVLTLL